MIIELYFLVGFLGGIVAGEFFEDKRNERKLDQCHKQLQMEYRSKPHDDCIITRDAWNGR